jgi:CRISPR-associated protein Cmr5
VSTSAENKSKSIEQCRAAHAWEAVQRVKVKPHKKKYGDQAKKLPTRIMAAGLGQALAFLAAKDYAPELPVDIGDWVLDKRGNPGSTKPALDKHALIKAVMAGSSDFLRRATDEALAYLQWLNRFAEAEGLTDKAEEAG